MISEPKIFSPNREVYLSLGSNQGDRLLKIVEAIRLIHSKTGKVVSVSPVYESEPWGFETNESFLNIAIAIETFLSPIDLLNSLQNIEKNLGRNRNKNRGYTSRPIDIDILFHGQQVVQNERLVLPHPLLHLRKFVLMPMNDIAPDLIHPLLNKTIKALLTDCPDQLAINKTQIEIRF